MRTYATQLWAQRRGFTLPADPAAAQQALFDCDRKSCVPKAGTRPALGAWWTRAKAEAGRPRRPLPRELDPRHARGDRAAVRLRAVLVLGPQDFARGGAAEIYAAARRMAGAVVAAVARRAALVARDPQ